MSRPGAGETDGGTRTTSDRAAAATFVLDPVDLDAELARDPAVADDRGRLLGLIHRDVVRRQNQGEVPRPADYQARFPNLAGPIAELFDGPGSLGQPERVEAVTARGTVGPTGPCPAPVGEPAVPTFPESPRVRERYEVLGVLGRGGMGVVHEAIDRVRGVRVAIKTMKRADALAIDRFKQEFRSLQDVAHPNLVNLHELISDGESWFIVMEYVDGCDFLVHVRDGPGEERSSESDLAPPTRTEEASGVRPVPDRAPVASPPPPPVGGLGPLAMGRLRSDLRQLAGALEQLHRSGKLHRDVKPSNVLVTREGRVVLMDFGLATNPNPDPDPDPTERSVDGRFVGTPSYMAPEQAAGKPLGPAADWYAVGTMLHEALTGRRPFTGSALQILIDKQSQDARPPRDLVPDLPEDWNALCVDLLRRDPDRRPTGAEVLARLGGEPAPIEPPTSLTVLEPPMIGREAELAALDSALRSVVTGGTVVVSVRGPSGVGKSTLVRQFVRRQARQLGALTLSGRCHERESVPYKALDSLIDALGRHLRRTPAADVQALLPRSVAPLVRVFPTLRRVSAIAEAPSRGGDAADPRELRRRAFGALRELLARLGDRRPLVLAIDDLQWGDRDSLAAITEVLRPPEPPNLLLIACYRADSATETDREMFRSEGIDCRDLVVGPLSAEESEALARQALGDGDPERPEAVARESAGNPYLAVELARWVASAGPDGPRGLSIDQMIASRVAQLPEEARSLLEVVAVSGIPLPSSIAWRCLDRTDDERASLAQLRVARLIRSTRAAGPEEADRIEAYHDRIRETVAGGLSAEALRDRHARLARVLSRDPGTLPEVLAEHLLGAGAAADAADQFGRAARQAAESLAFGRAAALYRRALEYPRADATETRALLVELGQALANDGRGAEAAEAFLQARDGAPDDQARDLRRRAAAQWLISGHIDRGLDALRLVAAEVGAGIPQTPRQALGSLLVHRAWLRLRGLAFRPRPAESVPAGDLNRIDVLWSAGIGLSNVDWIRGAEFQVRGLLAALRVGEPTRVGRALTLEAAHCSTAGWPARRRTARLLDAAQTYTQGSGDPYAQGMVALARGVSSYLESRWADALPWCDRAEATFREHGTGVAWELDTANAYALWALSHLGHWAELAHRYPARIAEARERGDLYAVMNLSTYILAIVRLAADEPSTARDELGRVRDQWSNRGYHVQHNDLVWATALVDLYEGDGPAAWAGLRQHWPTLSRSMLLRVQFIRVAMRGLRGRAALAAADGQPSGDPRPLLRSAARDADWLDRERIAWASAQAAMIRAALAHRDGRRDDSIRLLRTASSTFQDAQMILAAAVADRRLGAVLGGNDGLAIVSRADAEMTAQAIRNPSRVADLYGPGFSGCSAGPGPSDQAGGVAGPSRPS